jgi:DNA-binding beta-propeller fold protein YncE
MTKPSRVILIVCIALPILGRDGNALAEDAGYVVEKTLHVGGDGGFDFVTIDLDGRRLYLPRSSHTQIVDTTDGKVLADIPDNSRSHGVALVPEVGRGFISNGGDGTVQIFDLKSNISLGKIKAADDADGIIYDPASKSVLTMCGDAHALVAIPPNVDPKDGKASSTIDLGGKPEFGASDGQGKVFVDLVENDEIAVVDSKAMKVIAKWPIAPAKQPVGMALDVSKKRLYVGCRSKDMVIMSAEDGHILADLPIGEGVDATAFRQGIAFASCRDGTLTVIREIAPDKFEVAQTVKTAPRAKTMAVDDKTGRIYLPTADGQGRSITPGSFRVLVVGRSLGK